MILLDTETTGLTEISVAPLDSQPRVLELFARRVDDQTLETQSELHFMCSPGIPIPEKVTQITGITDDMVKGERRFAAHYLELAQFFLGETILVAHNLPYDRTVLLHELTRIDKITQFPWPYVHICTVERSQDLTNKYLTLTNLYIHYYGTDPHQLHRGAGDVDILHAVVRAMRKEGRL
jgi:DNA polymerase III epsilon subunit-like protein